MVLLPLASVVVYPKELSCDDFATAPAAMAEAVEVDHFRQGYFQIPSLDSAHFLFATYIVHTGITPHTGNLLQHDAIPYARTYLKIDLWAFDPSSVSHLND